MQIFNDQHFRALRRVLANLRPRSPEFVTTTWTLYEALAIAKRPGHSHAVALYQQVEGTMEVLPIGGDLEEEAFRRFLFWSDKTASVVDHANLLAAVEHRCEAILSFDNDFAPMVGQAGLQLLR